MKKPIQRNEPVIDTTQMFVFNQPRTLWAKIKSFLRRMFSEDSDD